MIPTQDGLYLNLPDKRGLLVNRDANRQVVAEMALYENWGRPINDDKWTAVETFVLPAAETEPERLKVADEVNPFE